MYILYVKIDLHVSLYDVCYSFHCEKQQHNLHVEHTFLLISLSCYILKCFNCLFGTLFCCCFQCVTVCAVQSFRLLEFICVRSNNSQSHKCMHVLNSRFFVKLTRTWPASRYAKLCAILQNMCQQSESLNIALYKIYQTQICMFSFFL